MVKHTYKTHKNKSHGGMKNKSRKSHGGMKSKSRKSHGGMKHKTNHKSKTHGGMGGVVKTAVVPFGLLAAQKHMQKKKGGSSSGLMSKMKSLLN